MESQQAGQEKACTLREDFHLGHLGSFPRSSSARSVAIAAISITNTRAELRTALI